MTLFLILLQAALAVITAPASGDSAAGALTITGTASGPQFERYEIAFAYDPNPTDTWFELQPPSPTPVVDGTLAVWDTRAISDGNYMIRLRVYSAGSNSPVETIIRNIQVRNTAPGEAPTVEASLTAAPTPTLALLETTATPLPEPTPTVAATSSPAPPAPFLNLSTYSSAFCNGVYLSFLAFILLGIYVALHDKIRRLVRRWLRRIMSDIRKP